VEREAGMSSWESWWPHTSRRAAALLAGCGEEAGGPIAQVQEERNGEALVPPLPAGAGSAGRLGDLRCLPELESLYSPDNTGVKITRLHSQRDKSEVCLLCLSGQWDSSTNGAVWT